ncbi:sporulation protein YabP [Clostridiisalibacter paucivorans]|uniref:sporulation protein YabP n=1 Tax=Clostridiisalibacter paucivorans TaxID=408753 RepID=UPI00047B9EB7|nr:sporulation protein YabP [Clostridiisalibacter paucivorans]
MDNNSNIGKQQNLILENRKSLSISGIEHVNSFDENTIVLSTVQGLLTITGKELNINKVNLEDGNVKIEGHVEGLVYSNKEFTKEKGKGFLKKMFK